MAGPWALLTVLGFAAFDACSQSDPAASAASAAAAGQTQRLDRGSFGEVAIRPQREVVAVVVARNDSRIGAEVSGTVLRWGPDTGATVRRGDLLAEIDPTDHRLVRDRARAAGHAAQARASMARSQLARARDLLEQGFFSREALAARETELALAEADAAAQELALTSADRSLAKTRVVAPFDAAVRQRLVQVGEGVVAGTPLYQLVQLQGAEVSAQLAPQDADSLRRSKSLSFVRADGSASALTLRRVATVLNSPARTVEVRLAGGDLVPGRDGRLVWIDPRPHVPAALLVRRQGELGVFGVVEGRARFLVLPGAQEGRAAPAPFGPQTVIVTQGHQSLRDGDPVDP